VAGSLLYSLCSVYRCRVPTCILLLFGVLILPLRGEAQEFRVDTLARAPYSQHPIAIAFAPDSSGVFVFTEKLSGRVRVFERQLLTEPFLTATVEGENEQGLLGVAYHPSYPDTPFLFVYYTRLIDRANVLERYRDSAGVGIDPKLLMIVPRLDEAGGDNGGPIHFGPDGMLYVSVGDHASHPEHAQDVSSKRNVMGKILRLNPDGSLPADNPFPNKAIWAAGLRNCRGFAFDPVSRLMYCTEGGIDRENAIFTVFPGGNLGWPARPKNDTTGTPISPMYVFRGNTQPDLTGIAVYRSNAFPRLEGKLLFVGNAIPHVWTGTLTADKDSLIPAVLFRLNTGFSDVAVGPDGCIYLTNGPTLSSRIIRLSPLPAKMTTTSPPTIMQGMLYTYTPVFDGTPPTLQLISAPEGMTLDTVDWMVRWTPTNDDAMRRIHPVTLRATNGAAEIDYSFVFTVENVNDSPLPFALGMPGDETINMPSEAPSFTFRWARASDPDGDTVRYSVQIDTTTSFGTTECHTYSAGESDSLSVVLPGVSREYYWRVIASDGQRSTVGTPAFGKLSVAMLPPSTIHAARVLPLPRESAAPLPQVTASVAAIRYAVARTGMVRLAIFNMLGQEVRHVVNGVQEEGMYEIALSKLHLPHGIYFYRIDAPGISEMKKIIITEGPGGAYQTE
jgi:aldose sugar dehydrogenase